MIISPDLVIICLDWTHILCGDVPDISTSHWCSRLIAVNTNVSTMKVTWPHEKGRRLSRIIDKNISNPSMVSALLESVTSRCRCNIAKQKSQHFVRVYQIQLHYGHIQLYEIKFKFKFLAPGKPTRTTPDQESGVVRVNPWQIRGSSLAGPGWSGVGPGCFKILKMSGIGPGCFKMFKTSGRSGAVREALQSGANPALSGCKPYTIRTSSG